MKKVLQIPAEWFFALVLKEFGLPPPRREWEWFRFNDFEIGLGAYLRHHPHGRKFTELLDVYGEAKTRTARWFIRYMKWYQNKQDRWVEI